MRGGGALGGGGGYKNRILGQSLILLLITVCLSKILANPSPNRNKQTNMQRLSNTKQIGRKLFKTIKLLTKLYPHVIGLLTIMRVCKKMLFLNTSYFSECKEWKDHLSSRPKIMQLEVLKLHLPSLALYRPHLTKSVVGRLTLIPS